MPVNELLRALHMLSAVAGTLSACFRGLSDLVWRRFGLCMTCELFYRAGIVLSTDFLQLLYCGDLLDFELSD